MKTRTYTRSMGGGIISPSMVGRIDDSRRDSGLSECENFIVLPEGIVTRRPGTRMVRAAKNDSKKARVLPFRYSSTQTMCLEFGEAYIRFHTFGATLLTPTTGLDAWNSGDTYSHGDLVTYGGKTYYAFADVPANKQPDLFLLGAGTPIVTGVWQETAGGGITPPPGYTYVGSELPTTVTIGAQVYIGVVEYDSISFDPFGEGYGGGLVAITTYYGYTGVAGSSIGGEYWYEVGEAYEIPSPYAEGDLFDIHYTQSGDVVTLVHPKYAPRELRRLGATTWTLETITFGSVLSAPAIANVVAHTVASPSDLQPYAYVATNVSDDQLDESVASANDSDNNQLADSGAYNTISFGDAARRNVYRLSGGRYGFIGQTVTTTLVDDNIAPDTSRTPPDNQNPFATDWPAAVCYFVQRRGFGGTPALPQSLWLTKVGTESNLDYSIPPRDDDAISVKIAAREASTVRHMVPLGDLIILTSSGEFSISSDGPLTPTSARRTPSTGYVGASNVQPVVVDDDLIYAAARGGHLRGLGYSFDRARYVSVDLSVRAAHLFDFKQVVDMGFARSPTPIVWNVSSDGRLVGLTYVPSEEVRAFHVHSTVNGAFESCCAVAEGDEDIVYVVVKRTFNEVVYRFIECFAARMYTDNADAFFVDCGATYSGTAETDITGLGYIEGQTVAVLADAAVVARQTVSGGAITLPTAAEKVQVGLPVTSILRPLPIAVENDDAFGQGVVKLVGTVVVNIIESHAFYTGPDFDHLREVAFRTTEPWGQPPAARTGDVDCELDAQWDDAGQFYIVAVDPTPLTILSLTKTVDFGG